MTYGANFPSGCWKIEDGRYTLTNFKNSQVFAMGGVPVLSHEPYGSVGLFNMSDFLDPTSYGDMSLMNRRITSNMDVITGWMDTMRYAGLNSFNIEGSTSGAAPSGTPVAPSGTPSVSVPTFAPSNPYGPSFVPSNPYGPSYTPTNPSSPSSTPEAASNSSDDDDLSVPAENDYKAQLNARLSLIENYCDKYGKIVNVDKIREEYADDAEGGVAYCDDILNNKFDQTRLEKMVHKEYQAYNKHRLDNAKNISDELVETIQKGGLDSVDISTSSINKKNILDVIGTFMTNEEVKNGKVSLENVFESPEATLQLINTLKARADELLLDENADDDLKDLVVSQIAVLRDNYDKYQDAVDAGVKDYKANGKFIAVRKTLSNGFIELFKTLRLDEAYKNDEKAPQHYGLPEDSEITFDDQTRRANEEIRSYNGRRRLSTTF